MNQISVKCNGFHCIQDTTGYWLELCGGDPLLLKAFPSHASHRHLPASFGILYQTAPGLLRSKIPRKRTRGSWRPAKGKLMKREIEKRTMLNNHMSQIMKGMPSSLSKHSDRRPCLALEDACTTSQLVILLQNLFHLVLVFSHLRYP